MTRHNLWLTCSVMALTLFVTASVFADDDAPASSDPSNESGLGQLFELVSSSSFPSLSGLIQPEKMGVLTDNQDNFSDNKVFSDNAVEVNLLSNNEVKILSDVQILSGISVNITTGGAEMAGRDVKHSDRGTNEIKELTAAVQLLADQVAALAAKNAVYQAEQSRVQSELGRRRQIREDHEKAIVQLEESLAKVLNVTGALHEAAVASPKDRTSVPRNVIDRYEGIPE